MGYYLIKPIRRMATRGRSRGLVAHMCAGRVRWNDSRPRRRRCKRLAAKTRWDPLRHARKN